MKYVSKKEEVQIEQRKTSINQCVHNTVQLFYKPFFKSIENKNFILLYGCTVFTIQYFMT
jgi:hypothetical protein